MFKFRANRLILGHSAGFGRNTCHAKAALLTPCLMLETEFLGLSHWDYSELSCIAKTNDFLCKVKTLWQLVCTVLCLKVIRCFQRLCFNNCAFGVQIYFLLLLIKLHSLDKSGASLSFNTLPNGFSCVFCIYCSWSIPQILFVD